MKTLSESIISNLLESTKSNLYESEMSDIAKEYYNKLSDFFSKYNITFSVRGNYIYFYYKDNYFDSNDLQRFGEKGRVRDIVCRIQDYLMHDDYFVRNYMKSTRLPYEYNIIDSEFRKEEKEFKKELHNFVKSCRYLEKKEAEAFDNEQTKKEEKKNNLLGDDYITIVYTPNSSDAPNGANLNEVKNCFSDLKHTCEKVGSKYYFMFNRNDLEEVRGRYNSLVNVADVTLIE